MYLLALNISFFFFNDTATTEIYTLSLHDALPILFFLRRVRQVTHLDQHRWHVGAFENAQRGLLERPRSQDRKSTRLNSSHLVISYAVFCLKKKTNLLSPHVILLKSFLSMVLNLLP